MSFKINKPIKDLELPENARTKYYPIYEAALALKDGLWIPVEFDNEHQALNFRTTASNPSQGGKGRFECFVKGNNRLYSP